MLLIRVPSIIYTHIFFQTALERYNRLKLHNGYNVMFNLTHETTMITEFLCAPFLVPSGLPSASSPTICLLLLQFVFCGALYKWNDGACAMLCLLSLTRHNYLEINPCCCMHQQFISFSCYVIAHYYISLLYLILHINICVYIRCTYSLYIYIHICHNLLILFPVDGTSVLCSSFGCNE